MVKGKPTANDVRKIVRSGYAEIAVRKRGTCCSGGRAGHFAPAKLAQAVGYDSESLDKLPDGVNMGLSCGNPLVIAELKLGQTVVDLGSGGGFDVFQAGQKVGDTGRVIGIDMTPEMIDKARSSTESYKERTGLDNVEFRLGEIEHLPVADKSVDVVISNCVINLSPDKKQVWSEIHRVLKEGGKAAVSDLALLKPLPEEVREVTAALVGCMSGAILIDETKKILEEQGFKHLKLTPNPDYVRMMLEWNDPLYKQIIELLPQEESLADYIVSLSIEAFR